MNIRPVQPTDRAEWCRMRDSLWPGSPDDHVQEIDAFFSSPQNGVAFVVERPDAGSVALLRLVSVVHDGAKNA